LINQFIDDFYDVLFKPVKGINRVAAERTIWHGLVVYMAVSLVSSLTAIATSNPGEVAGEFANFWSPEAMALLLSSSPALSLISIIVFAPILLFVWSAILNFSAELLGGQGRGMRLGAAIGYAQLPYILIVPLSLAARYLALDVVGVAGFAAFIWSVYLKITAIRAVHSFSLRRAALAYFLPAIVLLAAVIIFILFLSAFLMPLLMEIFPF
jgi:hypothetical protein